MRFSYYNNLKYIIFLINICICLLVDLIMYIFMCILKLYKMICILEMCVKRVKG